MSNDKQHEMLAFMLHIMLYIFRVHYQPILMKFSDNHVGMIFQTRMFSVKDLNLKNKTRLNIRLSDQINEYFQELVIIYDPPRHIKHRILQLRYI